MRSIQSRWVEDWCFKELPAGGDEVPTDAGGRELRLRRSFGRHHRERSSGQSRGRLPRNVDTDVRPWVCVAEELEVGEGAHPGAIRPGRRRSDCIRQQRRTLFSNEHSSCDLGLGSRLPLDSRRGCYNKWDNRKILTRRSESVRDRLGARREYSLCQWTVISGVSGQERYFVRRCNGKQPPLGTCPFSKYYRLNKEIVCT